MSDGTKRLEAMLGHLTADEMSVALTRRIEGSDTERELTAGFEVPDLAGERIVLGETLGQGGAGVVLRGVQRSLNRDVAVKRVRPDRSDPSAEVGLWREAWIGGLLAHPNIVAIYDLDVDDDGRPAIVCQHVDGRPWTERLAETAETRLEPAILEEHLRVLLRICDAVAFAHDRGFLHRDLKPENVMLGRFGEVYLIDWGIATAIDDRHGTQFPLADDVRSISGTPGYMAPELLRDSDDETLFVGVTTDVYLLGGCLFHILCGRPPHLVGRFDEMLESIRVSQFDLPAEVPREIALICERALEREPAKRYPSVGELASAIGEFLAKQRARLVLAEADEKLVALVESNRDESSPVDRMRLYRLFSECRFGYSAVADVLGPEAQRGTTLAAETMVAYELDRGDPDAAEALLAEVEELSDDVLARIAVARDLKDAELATLQDYAAVGRSHDTRRGLQARFFLGCLGVLFLLAGPVIRLIGHWSNMAVNEVQQMVSAALAVSVFGGVAWFSRRFLRRRAVTRAATMVFMTVGVVHTLLGISAYWIELDAGVVRIINCYVIGMGCVVFGWLFERGMLWSGLVFFAAGIAITANVDDLVLRNLLLLGAGVFFALNAVLVWGPSSRSAYRATKKAAS